VPALVAVKKPASGAPDAQRWAAKNIRARWILIGQVRMRKLGAHLTRMLYFGQVRMRKLGTHLTRMLYF